MTGTAAALLAAMSALAGTLNTTFDSDPGGVLLGRAKIENGILKLTDLQELIDGTGGLPIFGSYVFPDIDGGQKVASFNAKFKVSIHGGTETPAQGFSFVLSDDLAGLSDPFREGGATAEGAGFRQGLIISFDLVDNLPGFGANGNDPGDAPGIIVRLGGQKVAARRFANLRTGPSNNQTPNFVPVEINLDADGTLDVTYNGVKVYDNFGIPYAPIAGLFGVGAGTAELTAAIRANHWFDDMTITTGLVGAGPLLLSAQPLGTAVRPDALVAVQVENLGGAAVQVQFDDQTVAHQTSVAGAVTTITYDPPGILAPGSTHRVRVTYGGRVITWSFTVLNAIIIPPSFAAAPNTVDTAQSGFSVRVHQLETAAPGNTYQRAEDQLAGKLGPNVADLSQANPDGSFNRELINMEQDGFEAGNFNATEGHPDELIPGIPGSVGNTDNIAMEVRGYIELTRGVHTLGLVSDDNARLTIGPDPRDVTGARLIDIAIGAATSTILVDADGIYPFRVVWAEGGGGAHLELWSVTAGGTRVLLNDRATAGHLKVYRQLRAGVRTPPYLSAAKPAPGDINVSTTPSLELAITEELTQVNPASIQLFLNGSRLTLAPGAVTKAGSVTTIRHRVTAPLNAKAEQTLRLEFADSAGQAVTRQYTFTTGAGPIGASFAGGQWDFDGGNLRATVGRDLKYIDAALANRYSFGTASSFGIPGIGGKDVKVIHIPYTTTDETDAAGPIFKRIGLRMQHNITPNGGGRKLNQYTWIIDLYWGENGSGFGSILQTHDFDNPTDGDMFWRASDGSYGKGCCSNYDGISQEPGRHHKRGEWARVVFSVDITQKRVAKYVNGFLHRADVGGDGANIDGRFALPPEVFVFGDGDDNERSECYVNSMQIREGALTDEEVAALGGPSPDGIPLPYAHWEFDDGNLAASVGHDLQYIDNSLANRYAFGTASSFGIPGIGDKDVRVIHIPFTASDEADANGPIFKRIGLRVNHGLGANGGGQKLNQYTWIMDLYWGENGSGFGSILQTHDFANPTDGDMFWRASDGSYGKGCCSNYDGISQEPGRHHKRGEWARVVFSVDIPQKRVAKYVNGFLHRADVGGDGANIDGRFALPPEFFIFGDGDDNERSECYVNSIQFRAGAMTDDEVAALGGPSRDGIPTPNPVKGEWNGSLEAFIGQDLTYIDPSLASRYAVGRASSFGIPGIDSKDVQVLHIPFTASDEADAAGPIFRRIGLRVNHGIPPNGGGSKVNQWTWIMDLFWGPEGSGFGSILQTHDFANPTDGDMFWRASDGSYGKGCCSNYDGISQEPGRHHKRGEWARVVFSADITQRRLAKYVNGFLHRADVGGDGANIDGRFALPPEIFIFGDGDDNERSEAYVAAIQFREGALTDEEVAVLGGPSPFGIPGAPAGARVTAQPVTIELLGASSVLGPYAPVPGAAVDRGAKTITVARPGATTFYRVKGVSGLVSISLSGGNLVIRY